jgi:hypothetical protein
VPARRAIDKDGSAVVVAIPFACMRPNRVSVRGLVLCPPAKAGHLLSRFDTCGDGSVDERASEERGSGRDWIKTHFDLGNPWPSRIPFPPFGYQRYRAFARVRDVLVERNRLSVSFDMFVGPGAYAVTAGNGDKANASARAVHGFADMAHYPVFDHEVAQRQGGTVTGHAALCLVEEPYDFLGDDGRLRDDRILQVVTTDEVRAMLLVEATADWRKRKMGFDPNAVVDHEARDPRERGFIFRARLAVKLPEVPDQQVVGL